MMVVSARRLLPPWAKCEGMGAGRLAGPHDYPGGFMRIVKDVVLWVTGLAAIGAGAFVIELGKAGGW